MSLNCLAPNAVLRKYDPYHKDFVTSFAGSFSGINKILIPDNVEVLKVPCGVCSNCRLNNSKDWSFRIMAESLEHKSNYFVTVTYDDDHYPDCGSLVKSDIQLFIRSLRDYYRNHYNHEGIRYYLCGEYGDISLRPHYHICFFNLPLYDLKFYKRSDQGHSYFNSEILTSIWGKGYIVVTDLTIESAAYTARYVMKKQLKDDREIYERFNLLPEFVLMSTRPGIGKNFYLNNYKSMFDRGTILLPSSSYKKNESRIPRYYKKLLESDDPELLESYKERVIYIGDQVSNLKLSRTDLLEEEYLEKVAEKQSHIKNMLTKSII